MRIIENMDVSVNLEQSSNCEHVPDGTRLDKVETELNESSIYRFQKHRTASSSCHVALS